MALYYVCVRETGAKIWGLTVSERLARLLRGRAAPLVDPSRLAPGDEVLVFRADYLLDDRLVRYLLTRGPLVLHLEGGGSPIAARVPASLFAEVVSYLEGGSSPPAGIEALDLRQVKGDFLTHLKKFEPPFALAVRPGRERELEKRLFDWSYKGVTDLVTKWVWPWPARQVVRLCVKLGLRPNHVTALSFVLVVLAGYLFYQGHLALGLVVAWLMTFFDTVDGKLARVTVTSSRFGHYFDHVIDLVHQPIWYVLFALGAERVGAYQLDLSVSTLAWVLVAAYVVGRLVEGVFSALVGGFSIFTWRPVDSFFRLVMARRNPCLIILTAALVLGRPDYGYLGVTVWMVLSALFLLVRLLQAVFARRRGPLAPWLSRVEEFRDHPLAAKWFTRTAP